jgi:CDGSH-type Zn-finger protein
MTTPVRASDTPFAVAVEQGKDYWWCSCGKSRNQPFCDGSHKADGDQPLCDGAHKQTS